MLEKLNSILYDKTKGTVLKCVTSCLEARSEKACLGVLSQKGSPESPIAFNVPKLFLEESSEYTVCMEYVPGIRVYDLLALLNHIIRVHPDKRTVSKAYLTKHDLIGAAIRMVMQFQSERVQNALRSTEGNSLEDYDFKGKLIEATNYLQLWSNVQPSGGLLDEVDHIADFLSQRVQVAFRDATLKNFIIQVPTSDGGVCDYCDIAESVGDYLRPTNWQWTDTGAGLALLDSLSNSEKLENCIYSIDFESAHSLTTKQDDFLHLFTLEVVGTTYEIAQRFMERQLGVGEEALNYAILLRCLRDGTRRLFYKCERPTIFATRYFHETVEHLLLVALEALERLRLNSSKADFLGGLYSLLVQFKTSHAPWPWQLSMTPVDWTTEN
ncbi:MAG: hypothetical protein ABIL58_14055 [Pseudomonadota bacterium]